LTTMALETIERAGCRCRAGEQVGIVGRLASKVQSERTALNPKRVALPLATRLFGGNDKTAPPDFMIRVRFKLLGARRFEVDADMYDRTDKAGLSHPIAASHPRVADPNRPVAVIPHLSAHLKSTAPSV